MNDGVYCMSKLVKRGDIYFADLRNQVGSEQGGVRPVLIIQNDHDNRYSDTTIVIPLTNQEKSKQIPTHVDIKYNMKRSNNVRNSFTLTEQIKVIDKKRLKNKIGIIDNEDLKKVEEAIKISLALE
jgi:mRNA interferase MazF